jgi:hypothetical protein
MSRKLNTTVYVHNEDGTSTAYGPGDTPSAEDAKKITNPDVWEDDKDKK